MPYDTIAYALADEVATIRLNRPDKMNALNAAMRRELVDALSRAPGEARAVVLTGNGPGFCAGQDLGDVRRLGELNLEQVLREEYEPLLRLIYDCPVPTVCAVNGVAAGAGANLALAADIVVAARSARFIEAFARIGLIPDAGGTYWLPRLVGQARARAMCLLAEPIPADTAAEWGLIWEAIEDDALEGRALELARRLASGPGVAYRLTKRALMASPANDLDAQLSLEAELQAEAGQSRDFMEGVMAFLEKRAARFEGR
jgi:2-(1,2-epoxy-1,2-dihydrophenyl)acetyl-CoA isomerase